MKFELRWSRGALRALAVATGTLAAAVAAHWKDILAFFGVLSLTCIVFTPLDKRSPEDALFFRFFMVSRDYFFSCDFDHSREARVSLSLDPPVLPFSPGRLSSLNLGGDGFAAVPAIFRG